MLKMDSKYSLIGSNSHTVIAPKFVIKSKPTTIIFNQGPKRMKSDNDASKLRKPAGLKPSIQDQRFELPIYRVRKELIEHIKMNDTLVIIGETGSGKTTQIPQFIYSAGLHNKGQIGITQPRRVAAITIALRVAQEMNTVLGDIVGYSVRFESAMNYKTKVKYLTDGMLLREAMGDKLLLKYSVLILDEAHERTIHTDVLFGIVKEAQHLRKSLQFAPLKLLIMSATMDVDHFSQYFNNCKVVYIEGRTYPIEVLQTVELQEDYQFSCLTTLFKIHREAPPSHDVLIFLTGQEEIEAMANVINKVSRDPELTRYPMIRVHPLYASLSSEYQLEVFRQTPSNVRKVILSTNIAETSITITGVKYVIDSGKVKSRTYHVLTGLDSLKVVEISQAQAWQRAGRAGRDSPGICYRMYTKNEFEAMRMTTIPEIQRCNLSTVTLQLLALHIDPARFDFMDKPSKESIDKAYDELKLLGAVENGKLTKLGEKMANFPLEPRFSKILLSSKEYGCHEEILIIISMLSIESVLMTPSAKREQAIAARQKFASPYGDHITLLNIFRGFVSTSYKVPWCRENFLNYRNLVHASNVKFQVTELCYKYGMTLSSCGSNMDLVRKCLITGLFMNVAELYRNESHKTNYITLHSNQVASIYPGSFIHGQKPHCIIFTDVMQTTNCYLTQVTTIESDWLNDIVPEYMKTHQLSAAIRGN